MSPREFSIPALSSIACPGSPACTFGNENVQLILFVSLGPASPAESAILRAASIILTDREISSPSASENARLVSCSTCQLVVEDDFFL